MGDQGSTWQLEIQAAEGKCRAYLVHTRHGHQPTVWRSTEWQLPDVPVTERLILEEFLDIALVLQEQLA